MVCTNCSDSVTNNNIGVHCCNKSCSKVFHATCIGFSLDSINLFTSNHLYWFCKDCRSNPDSLVHLQDLKVINKAVLETEYRNIIEQFNQTIEGLKSDINKIIQEPISAIIPQINFTTARVCNLFKQQESLDRKLESIEIHQRRLNLEINGIPFKKGQDLKEIVCKIGTLIELPSCLEIISDFRRIRSHSNKPSKPIILSFVDIVSRNNFLYLAKKSRNLFVHNLGFSGINQKFFVNEHLTAKKKEILYTIKSNRTALKFSSFFVKSGRIFLLLENQVQPIEILNLDQLTELIEKNQEHGSKNIHAEC